MTPEGSGRTIAHTSPYALGHVSGVSRVIQAIATLTKGMGFDSVIVCPSGGEPTVESELVLVDLRIPFGRNWTLGLRTAAAVLRRRARVSVVHAHQVHVQSLFALFTAKMLGTPSLLTLHVRVPEGRRIPARWERLLAGACLDLATERVAVSASVSGAFRSRHCTVIPNGVHVQVDRPDRGFDVTSPPVFVFSGRVTETKGIFLLIRALASAAKRTPSIRVITYGPVDDPAGYRREKARFGVEHLVSDHGFDPRWTEAIRPGQVFVLPSYYEGMPLALLEAMSRGLAPIATPVGGIPEAVEDRQNGILVPVGDSDALADALTFAAQHPAEMAQMGQRARQVVIERFTDERMAGSYAALYRKLGEESQLRRGA